MAIRINLLAEVQAAEELRRKDPIKKAIWGAVIVVFLVGAYIGQLQFSIMHLENALDAKEQEWKRLKPKFDQVVANKGQIADSERRLKALKELAQTRILWATRLNAFSQLMTNVNNIQVTRLVTDQSYTPSAATKTTTNSTGVVTVGRPACVIEKDKLTITAKDFGKVQDANYKQMLEAMTAFPYFAKALDRSKGISLLELSPPKVDINDPNKSFVMFVLECQFEDLAR
ncbi:MAG: hypothetical protein WCO56_20580 [Verrucomicrobiota bacterium]